MTFASARDTAAAVREGAVHALDVTDAALRRIQQADGRLHAFRCLDADGARAAAMALDAARANGAPLGLLAGVPVAVKENVAVSGLPIESGSALRRGVRAAVDAPAIARLRAAGAVILGTTCMPEFGHLAFSHSPLGPATRNPWSPAHTPGGSSGGSAAAVAAGLVDLALGTDGGGSIRIPAACCGVVGHKPTLGRVPHAPLRLGFAPLSHLGPIARSVDDAALMLDVIAGHDQSDPGSLPPEGLRYSGVAAHPPTAGRLAWAPQLGAAPADDAVLTPCRAAVQAVEDAGLHVTTIDPLLPDLTEPWAVLFDVMLASLVRGRMDDVRRQSDASFIACVERGLAASATDYLAAEAVRRDAWDAMRALYRGFDAVLTPTLLQPPLPVDPATGVTNAPESWAERWFQHVYPFNLTGQPAVSVPVGTTPDGLPIGLQVVGPRLADGVTIGFAAAVERAVGRVGPPPPLPS